MTDFLDLTRPGALAPFTANFRQQEARVAAFVEEPEREERWRRELATLAAVPPGPLHGLPLGVKDIFHVDGLPTRAGSRLPKEELRGPEGSAVRRLRQAGAFVVGKTTTTEFAYFAPAGTRNPHALDHTPGGSSSGSAAAVATGQCALALGTQTIGSIGRPAAFCGILGYKPSYDRVERDGVLPLSESLDHVGLLARNLEVLRRGAATLVSDWQEPATAIHQTSLRFGVPIGPYLDRCGPHGRRHFDALCIALRDAGHDLIDCNLFPDFDTLAIRHRRLMAAEFAHTHRGWVEAYRDRYRPETLQLIEQGKPISRSQVEADRAECIALRCRVDAAFDDGGFDAWLSPPAPGPAPRGLATTGDPSLNLPWSQAGVPTLVLPAGRVGPLPLGIQLAGRFRLDEDLFAVAERLLPDLVAAPETVETSKPADATARDHGASS